MRTFTLTLALALALPAAAQDSFQELTRQSLEAYRVSQKINKEMNDACRETSSKLSGLQSRKWLLRGKPPEKKDVDKQRKYVEDLRSRLANEEAKLKAMEARATMTDADLAAAKAALDAEMGTVRAKLTEQQAPFKTRIKEATAAVAAKKEKYKAMLAGIIHATAKDVPEAVSVRIDARPDDGFFSANWYDADKKQIVWVHIRLRDIPKPFGTPKKLDGKHVIQTHSASQIWLWAGHYQLAFVPSNKAYKDPTKLMKALKGLVDLDALASAKVPKPEMTDGK